MPWPRVQNSCFLCLCAAIVVIFPGGQLLTQLISSSEAVRHTELNLSLEAIQKMKLYSSIAATHLPTHLELSWSVKPGTSVSDRRGRRVLGQL